ncbi:MAG: type II toxin-antitoxin system VapC family toxin [Planctomycetes bacterium]|nr:type II toxin-antitoxin system VapC family toxin [Planctomycetota bacterium]
MTSVFLETSALLRMLFGEKGAEEVRAAISASQRVFASRLLRVEAERALLRFALDHPDEQGNLPLLHRHLDDLWPVLHFFEVSREICDLAGRLAPASRLRTLDAIQLTTFQKARALDPAAALLSFDRRILEATEPGLDGQPQP